MAEEEEDVDEEAEETYNEMFADYRYEFCYVEGKGYVLWDGIIHDPYPLRRETILGFPDEKQEVCRGSCDLSEAELNSILGEAN